jgi:hypothetical protein
MVLLGLLGAVLVAVLIHRWHVPVQVWLPGAMSLYFVPYVAAALAFAFLLARAWRTSVPVERALAVVFWVVGPYAGIVLSIPILCAIAGECL